MMKKALFKSLRPVSQRFRSHRSQGDGDPAGTDDEDVSNPVQGKCRVGKTSTNINGGDSFSGDEHYAECGMFAEGDVHSKKRDRKGFFHTLKKRLSSPVCKKTSENDLSHKPEDTQSCGSPFRFGSRRSKTHKKCSSGINGRVSTNKSSSSQSIDYSDVKCHIDYNEKSQSNNDLEVHSYDIGHDIEKTVIRSGRKTRKKKSSKEKNKIVDCDSGQETPDSSRRSPSIDSGEYTQQTTSRNMTFNLHLCSYADEFQTEQQRCNFENNADCYGLTPEQMLEHLHMREGQKVWSLTQELFKLSKFGWYWGPITHLEAVEKLANQPDGAFLVRDSSDERYLLSLSFRSYGKTLHTRIEHCNGMFSFYAQPDSEGYPSIVDLIEHSMTDSQRGVCCYTRSRLPGAPSFPVILSKPVSRFTQVRSLQYLCRFVIRQYTRFDHIQQLPLPSKIKGWIEENQY